MATLRTGSSGGEVRTLQQNLMALGFGLPRAGADGKFGAETYKAVRDFQYTWGIGVDGVAGSETLNAINQAMALLNEGRWSPQTDPSAAPTTAMVPVIKTTPTGGSPIQLPKVSQAGITLPVVGEIRWEWLGIGALAIVLFLTMGKGGSDEPPRRRRRRR